MFETGVDEMSWDDTVNMYLHVCLLNSVKPVPARNIIKQ